jgi:hypothetical protein
MHWPTLTARDTALAAQFEVAARNTSPRGATHMGDRILTVADTSAGQVTAVLRTTGSTDADVLFAATTEFGRPFRNQKLFGFMVIAVGAALAFTVGMLVASVPLAIAGVWFWHKGNRNTAVIESAYTSYMASLTDAAGPAKAAAAPLNGIANAG